MIGNHFPFQLSCHPTGTNEASFFCLFRMKHVEDFKAIFATGAAPIFNIAGFPPKSNIYIMLAYITILSGENVRLVMHNVRLFVSRLPTTLPEQTEQAVLLRPSAEGGRKRTLRSSNYLGSNSGYAFFGTF